MGPGQPRRTLHEAFLLTGTAAVYFVAAKLGLSLGIAAEQVSAVWPPAGIALAAALRFGPAIWPAIAAGAFAANITANEPAGTALGITAGNTLEALAGAWMLRRVGFQDRLARMRDVLAFLAFGAGAGTTIAATIGVASLGLGGVHPWSAAGHLWRTWWVGDAMGALIVAPLVLTWATAPLPRWGVRRGLEGFALLGLLLAATGLVFLVDLPRAFAGHRIEYIRLFRS